MWPFPLPGAVLRGARRALAFDTCHRLFYNTVSNKTRLSRIPGNRIVYLCIFYFYTKNVGKAPRSTCGMCLGRHQGLVLWDWKSFRECLRQRGMSAGPTVVPCVPGVFVTGSSRLSFREAENCCENVQGTSTVRKRNKYAAFLFFINKTQGLVKKKDGIYTFILTFFNSQK